MNPRRSRIGPQRLTSDAPCGSTRKRHTSASPRSAAAAEEARTWCRTSRTRTRKAAYSTHLMLPRWCPCVKWTYRLNGARSSTACDAPGATSAPGDGSSVCLGRKAWPRSRHPPSRPSAGCRSLGASSRVSPCARCLHPCESERLAPRVCRSSSAAGAGPPDQPQTVGSFPSGR